MKPCLLQLGSVTQRMLDRLGDKFEIVSPLADGKSVAPELRERINAVMVYGGARLESELMKSLPNLKMVSNYGVGYDGIDASLAASRGIMVTHTPDVLNAEVANTTIMLMLATSRRLVVHDRYVRDGRWEREGEAPLTRSIDNRRVGILGLGRIGEEIAHRLSIFNCELAYHSRNQKQGSNLRYFNSLPELAEWAEFLVVITPGGAATRHLVNRGVIEALGPEGTLINVARGSVVDEAEMVQALADGRLGAAGLDVFEAEPKVPQALYAMENVVLQPHVGSATVETRAAMGDLACENLELFLAGKPVRTPVPECRDVTS